MEYIHVISNLSSGENPHYRDCKSNQVNGEMLKIEVLDLCLCEAERRLKCNTGISLKKKTCMRM